MYSDAINPPTQVWTDRQHRAQRVRFLSPPIPHYNTNITNPVVAALVFGSTVRAAGTSYTLGGGRNFNGTAARPAKYQNNLSTYADLGLIREYCNEGDPICAIGSEPSAMSNHLSYFEKYTDEAVKWAVSTARSQVQKNEDQNRTSGNNNNGQGQGGIGTSGASRPSNIVIDGARGTWGLCGIVVAGWLFFLSL